MQKTILPLLLLALALTACGDHSTRQAPPAEETQTAACPQLDKTFASITQLETMLKGENPQWEPVVVQTREVVANIRKNMEKSSEDCLFINHQTFPKRERFSFVEDFTALGIRMNESEGVNILLQLHGIFRKDPDISEYFEEEMGHFGAESPTAYATFFWSQPVRGPKILEMTSWDTRKISQLQSAYQELGAEKIVTYLKGLAEAS